MKQGTAVAVAITTTTTTTTTTKDNLLPEYFSQARAGTEYD
jgi:hypothetical protein